MTGINVTKNEKIYYIHTDRRTRCDVSGLKTNYNLKIQLKNKLIYFLVDSLNVLWTELFCEIRKKLELLNDDKFSFKIYKQGIPGKEFFMTINKEFVFRTTNEPPSVICSIGFYIKLQHKKNFDLRMYVRTIRMYPDKTNR